MAKNTNKGKFMKYAVVTKMNLIELIQDVNKMLKEGWQLQGGICSDNGTKYQALVKEEK